MKFDALWLVGKCNVRSHAKVWYEVECTEVGEGRTTLKRRRLINQKAGNRDCFQSEANLVVQGACADGIRLALCEIRKRLSRSAWIIAIYGWRF
jgi:hypothetical protein